MTLYARLVAYQPDGNRLGVLSEPSSWSASLPSNDTSALQVSYPLLSVNASFLEAACEVALEVCTENTKWVEPPNGRYLRLERTTDQAKGDVQIPAYQMPGYASLMDGVTVLPQKLNKATGDLYDKDGKRKFLSATVGQILQTVLTEARTVVPGLHPGLELGFSPTKDSAGADWARKITIYYEPGTSLLTALSNLAAQGQCDWVMRGRRLDVYNTDTQAKRSGILLPPAQDLSEAPVRASLAGLLHTAILVGDEGNVWRVDNAGAPTPWGTSMKVLTQGGVRDETTAKQMISQELEAGSRERVEYTVQLPVQDGAIIPGVNLRPGDWVVGRDKTGAGLDLRVYAETLSFDANGLKLALTLNDRFVDAQVRQAKRVKGIVNGASGDAGTGSTPTGVTPSQKAVPATPQGLVVETGSYWDTDRSPRAWVRASWGPVTQDVNGLAINVNYYELRVLDRQITVDASTPTGTVNTLPVGAKNVGVWVRAVSVDGVWGAWASATTNTVAPPPLLDPPTRPRGSCEYGMVTIAWDGKLQPAGGNPIAPPTHLDHVDVYEASSTGSTFMKAGSILGGVFVLDRQSIIGQTRFYRLVAVDSLGQESDPSIATRIEIKSKISEQVDEALAQVDQATKDVDQAQADIAAARQKADQAYNAAATKADQSALNTAVESLNKKNTITRSTTTPGTTKGQTVGDLWWQVDAGNQITGQWTWNGTTWAPTSASNQIIANLDVNKLQVLSSATFSEAVAQKMWADQLQAKAITTQQLLVAPTNLYQNPGFVLQQGFGSRWKETGYGRTPNGRAILVEGGGGQRGGYDLNADDERMTRVTSGSVLVVSVWVYVDQSISKGATGPCVYLDFRTTPSTNISTTGKGIVSAFYALPVDVPAQTWTLLQGTIAVPQGAHYARAGCYVNGGYTGVCRFADLSITRQTGAVMIADGAVSAEKILADEALFTKLATGTFAAKLANIINLNASRITAGVLNADRIGANSIEGGKIKAASITATQLAASSVTAKQLATDALNFKTARGLTLDASTINGGTINGTTFTSSSNGIQTLYIGSGQIRVKSNNYPYSEVLINGDEAASDAAQIQFRNYGQQSLGYYPGVYVTTTSNGGYDQGQLVVHSSETTINSTGRSELRLGGSYGRKWRLGTVGGKTQNGYNAQVSIENGYDSQYDWMLFNSDAGYQFRGARQDLLFRAYGLPKTTGGLALKMSTGSSWQFYYEGSTRSLKYGIEDLAVDPYRLLTVAPRTWLDRTQWEGHLGYVQDHAGETPTGQWDEYEKAPVRVPGLIAEEVRNAGLDMFCSYQEGQLEGVQYDRMWVLTIPILKDLKARVETLENQLKEQQ